MGQLEDSDVGVTAGAAGPFDQPLEMPAALDTIPHVVSCIPLEPADAPVTDRYGFGVLAGPAARFFAPAKVGGLNFYYWGRWWHSEISPFDWPPMANGLRWFQQAGTLAATQELSIPHGLQYPEGTAVAPDFVVAAPAQLPAAGQDFAVTLIDDTEIRIKNFDAVNTLDYDVRLWLVHSIQGNRVAPPAAQTLTRQDITIPAAGAPVVVPHGLVGIPDAISVYFYDVAVAGVGGSIYMTAPPDDTNVYFANADPAQGDLPAQVCAQRTHGIQL